jgi:hypothetical protein
MSMAEIGEKLTIEEQSKRLLRIAIQDPEHLKRWLEESGRSWLVFNSLDLVDALPFPDGVDAFMQLIACYRDYRSAIPSGRTETIMDPTLGKEVTTSIMKTDNLEVEELDRAIRFLIGQITELDPSWDINTPR